MKYVLEIYHKGECIEQRESEVPFWPEPLPGEQIYVEFQNPSYSDEHGFWWTVLKRRHLLFGKGATRRTLALHCTPDIHKGDPKV